MAMVMMADTQTWRFGEDSDKDADRVTYATGSDPCKELARKWGSDTGPVPVELPYENCASPNGAGSMLLCENCNKGTHLACLRPPLTTVPKGVWLCRDCDKPTEQLECTESIDLSVFHNDVTEDRATLEYLKTTLFRARKD